jgi:hypothetical protein
MACKVTVEASNSDVEVVVLEGSKSPSFVVHRLTMGEIYEQHFWGDHTVIIREVETSDG